MIELNAYHPNRTDALDSMCDPVPAARGSFRTSGDHKGMKRILGIVGSPRKNGNTHHMITRILEGARKNGAKTEIIFLRNYLIKECDGCHTCWKGKPCCKSDDMIGLYSKIIASDGFVFGTPIYWFGPTALMKGFIDRFAYFNCVQNRPEIKGKEAVVAVPFEDRTYKAASLVVEIFEKSFHQGYKKECRVSPA